MPPLAVPAALSIVRSEETVSFYTDVIQRDPRFRATAQIRDPGLLFPPFRAKVEAVIAKLATRGQRFVIIETYRSQERQEALYRAHATELQRVGVHGFGLACDCCRVIDGRAEWEGALYRDYGAAAETEGLVWGGSWQTIIDLVHVQYIAVAEQPQLFDLSWYPT